MSFIIVLYIFKLLDTVVVVVETSYFLMSLNVIIAHSYLVITQHSIIFIFLMERGGYRMLHEFQVYNIVVRQVYTLCSARHKHSFHPSPHKAATRSLTVFPMWCLSSLWLTPSIPGSLDLLLPFTHFAPPPAPPSGSCQFVLCL